MNVPATPIEMMVADHTATRQSFTFVHVDAANGRMFATDGAALVILPMSPDDDESGVLLPDTLQAAREFNGTHMDAEASVRVSTLEVNDAPKLDSVLKQIEGLHGASICLDATLLLRLAESMTAPGAPAMVRIFIPWQNTDPIRVEPWNYGDGQSAFGVLMPIRDDNGPGPVMPESVRGDTELVAIAATEGQT